MIFTSLCYLSVIPTNFVVFHRVPIEPVPPQLTSPTPHGVLADQSRHNFTSSNIRNFQDLACPAGVEPATYGLEGLKNLDKQ